MKIQFYYVIQPCLTDFFSAIGWYLNFASKIHQTQPNRNGRMTLATNGKRQKIEILECCCQSFAFQSKNIAVMKTIFFVIFYGIG